LACGADGLDDGVLKAGLNQLLVPVCEVRLCCILT